MSLSEALQLHKNYFRVEATHAAFAPGRINLIGEHTDYNDGFVFPAAIQYGIWATARLIDGETRMISTIAGPSKAFDALSAVPGDAHGWVKYAAGMAWALREQGHGPMPNIESAVVSSLPMGSGVSSSAALEMVFGRLWQSVAGLDLNQLELAKMGQKCENEFVGVNCGIMDQLASAFGVQDHALFIDTRTLSVEPTPVPADWSVVLLDTLKPRSLSNSAYNTRRTECQSAAAAVGTASLRELTLDKLIAAKSKLDPVVFRRARHVITENNRAFEFKSVLRNADTNGVFALMKGSHDSLRDDYEVTCAELDWMAEAAWTSPGVIGARMTGAGFGGACVALVHRNQLESFTLSCLEHYRELSGKHGNALICGLAGSASGLIVPTL